MFIWAGAVQREGLVARMTGYLSPGVGYTTTDRDYMSPIRGFSYAPTLGTRPMRVIVALNPIAARCRKLVSL